MSRKAERQIAGKRPEHAPRPKNADPGTPELPGLFGEPPAPENRDPWTPNLPLLADEDEADYRDRTGYARRH